MRVEEWLGLDNKLGIDICSALELFYNNKITHNDIKPGNIFIDQSGNYKLGDFGIATKLGGNNEKK